MSVICNDCVELHDSEAFFLCFCEAVKNQFFPDMFATDVSSYCVAGVADVAASSYVVRMQDVETDNFIVVGVYCNSGICLFFEKCVACFFC